MTKEDFMEEYCKTDIPFEISLAGFNDNNRVLQEAIRNVCSYHTEEFKKLFDNEKHRELREKIKEWYGEHLYKDYKERTWEGLGFHVWKSFRG